MTARDRNRLAAAAGEYKLRHEIGHALRGLADYVEHGAPRWLLEHCLPIVRLAQKLRARRRQPAEVIRLEDKFERTRLRRAE